MESSNLLNELALDAWYKVLIYLGGILFLLSLLVEVRVSPNADLQRLAGGMFLIGLGEWKNSKDMSGVLPSPGIQALKVSGTVRKPDFVGVVLQAMGVALVGWFIWSLYTS